MIATDTMEFLQRLRRGIVEKSDESFLEHVKVSEWVAELQSVFRLTFQERRIGGKWELSLARSLRTELLARPIKGSIFVSLAVVPVYVNCLMLNIENDLVTGVSRVGRLSVRAVAKPVPGLAITTGRGFKFDKAPDGWALKPLQRRTVRLAESFLKARGWRFDHVTQFIPTP